MARGRAISVRSDRETTSAIYIVAAPQPDTALDPLKKALSYPNNEYKDLGYVNDSLIAALDLKPGEFARFL
jgi:hypothetical protein